MGVYVTVKLDDGTVVGEMEILRAEAEVEGITPALDFKSYHYRYRLKGRDPVSGMISGYQGVVEHERSDWAWALIGKVLLDKDWER